MMEDKRFSQSEDGDFLDNGYIMNDVAGVLNQQDELIHALLHEAKKWKTKWLEVCRQLEVNNENKNNE